MLKKFSVKVFCIVAALFASAFVLSCANSIDNNNSALLGLLLADSKNQGYGSLTINSSSSRALNVSDISYARAYVTGTGITAPVVSTKDASVNGGKGSITVEKIPVGKNRVVTVYTYDSSNNKLGTVMLRGVTDINSGNNNSINIDKSTTLLGNVFEALGSAGVNLASVNKDDVQAKLAGAEKSWALYDSSAIASDYKSVMAVSGIKEVSTYEINPGAIKFTSYYDECSIQVGDPVSSIKENVVAGEGSLAGIAPGTWPVYVTKDGNLLKKTFATVSAGTETDIGYLGTVTDRIVVHAKYSHIWAWKTGDVNTNYTGGVWPGAAMTAESNGWYVYSFEKDVTSVDVVLSNNGSSQHRATGGDTLIAGEWWYEDGSWYDSNPDDSQAPVLESFTSSSSGTVSGDVIFYVTASDNKSLKTAVISIDGVKAKVADLSGDYASISCTIDTGDYSNGSHIVSCVVYDSAENMSASKSISLNFVNENKVPVALITGSNRVAKGKTFTYSAESSYDKNGSIAAYEWKVTGATPASGTASKISVAFPDSEGSATIKLRVKDNEGAYSEWVSKTVQIIAPKETNDFREETIYFVMTTRFFDGDTGNNVHCWDENAETPANDPAWRGDFKGLIQKLDYIKALGFSAVWITPVVENCSGLDYHGYHAMNFQKVDPRYESTDTDFQTLIDEVHARDMKLVLDVVFNHTGNFGEANLAPMFEKDYSANLEDINACLKLSANSLLDESYFKLSGPAQYDMRLKMMKNTDWKNHETNNYFHHFGFGNWDNFSVQFFQMAGDCVDLNTENPKVLKYIVDSYSKYIEMGVDAFRIDTGKHLSRLEFNCYLNDAFKEAASRCGNDNFYMFTEICAKSSEVTYRGQIENLSPYFYTWKDDETYGFTMDDENMYEGVIILPETNDCSNDEKDEQRVLTDLTYWTRETEDGRTVTPVNSLAVQKQGMATTNVRTNRPTSDNHQLKGNTYHAPDYSNASGLNVIDFPMHWNFNSASGAFGVHGDDKLYNDATWNVVYVDSHDYGPSDKFEYRYDKGTDAWAENMTLMFTFRGIPCLYYGSEVEFQAGCPIDKGSNLALKDSGRAYYGDYLEGTVNASDFGNYTATGNVRETLNKPLCRHLIRLNQIRRAIPALQKGQYSTDNCSGSMSFKRRFTDVSTGEDSFVLVTISGNSTFSDIIAGTYVDVITGDKQIVKEGGSLKASCTGKGNARIYVYQNATASEKGADGKIGDDTDWLK